MDEGKRKPSNWEEIKVQECTLLNVTVLFRFTFKLPVSCTVIFMFIFRSDPNLCPFLPLFGYSPHLV